MTRFFEFLWQDVHYALRIFRKTPVITAVALLSLALGIGANTAIFTLIDKVMLRLLPVQKPQELLLVAMRSTRPGAESQHYLTNPLWEQIRDQQDIFSGAFAWSTNRFDLAQGGEALYVDGLYASGDYFTTLGVRPAAGRLISASDDKRGCPGVAVVSYGFWQEHFGGTRDTVGRTLGLNGFPFEIIGVSAAGFFGMDVGEKFDVAVPLCTEAIFRGKTSMLDQRSAWWLQIAGRRKPGINAQQAAARLQVLSPGIMAASLPQSWKPEMQQSFLKRTLLSEPAGTGISYLRQEYERPLKTLMVVVALVLVIACANIASLMVARSAARRKEIAVRLAVGASRGRLIRQLLTECLLLATAGASLGVLFARWGDSLMVRFLSTTRDKIFLDLSLDPRVLGFTGGVAVITGLLFGMFPAWRATRVSLAMEMKSGQSGPGEGRGSFRPGQWIVALQVALSLVLVVGAGLFMRSFRNLLTLDIGFDRSNVLITRANFHNANIPQEKRAAVYAQALERLKALPGAVAASQSVLTPIGQMTWNEFAFVDGANTPSGEDAIVYMNYVTPDYFATLRSPLLAGRSFDQQDTSSSPRVAIINQTMARRFFPNADPLGKYFKMDEGPKEVSAPILVVGLLKDAKYQNLREEFLATAYFPATQQKQFGESPIFEIRTGVRPSTMAPAVQDAILGLQKGVSLEFRTLSQQVDDSLTRDRLLATLSGFFGGLALLLAVIGLYGVLAFMVTQRQKEIGIRMALGAAPGSILRLVMRDVAILLAVGVTAGAAMAAASTKFVQKMLFGLAPHDTTTIVLAAGVLVAVALLAGYLPARRASRTDPMVVLREE